MLPHLRVGAAATGWLPLDAQALSATVCWLIRDMGLGTQQTPL